MKQTFLYLSIVTLIVSMFTNVLPAAAAEANLIANSSVETASESNPSNWSQSRWGTNTAALEYKTDGRTGIRSLSVSMSARTNGDAKWMHDAVAVQPSSSYTYESWYKSTTATEIDLQYTDTAGNITYVYGSAVAPSATWENISVKFTTPVNVAKVSVMHIIASVGTLQTDDFSLNTTVVSPPADQDNFIVNNSFEIANGALPISWYKNSWGANTSAFSYETTGRTGVRSAKITVSSYTSGDAKWFAEASAVTAGKTYLYRDYYQSTVPTRVVAAFVDSNGNYSYQELAGAVASPAAWAQYSVTFAAPASAVKVSMYHVIDSVGTLTIDDTNLYVALPASAEPTVINPSLETSTSNLPTAWQKNSWGSNMSVFEYTAGGHTGTKSAKITMSNYIDGDAKWYFNPITTLTPGSQYRFTTWFKTNVTAHPVAMFIMADGTTQYFGMPIPQTTSTTTWQKYSDTFNVPVGAVSASVFMYIAQNGWLQTDDYDITSYSPQGFTRPLLTMTFDDGHEENATNALPILNQYGLKSTQCFATSFIEGQSQAIINGVKAFAASGHEICSHTVTHPFLTTSTNLTYELQHSQKYLKTLTGQTITDFASPYGDYNAKVVTAIKKYYTSHRSVDEGYNSKDNFNPYNLRVQNILDTTTATEVAGWITQAQTDKTWLILVFHRIADNPGPYDSTVSNFTQDVQAIVQSGITVVTTKDGLAEIKAQL